MLRIPAILKPGDRVRVIAPSGKVSQRRCEEGVSFLEQWGLELERGAHLYSSSGLFAGDDGERLADIQVAFDDPGVRAVFCARGGYGLTRIIDRIDFSGFDKNPKWIVGYSDITALHLWVNINLEVASIHGEMVSAYSDPRKSRETFDTLKESLFKGGVNYKWRSEQHVSGETTGVLTGGNLSLLSTLSGSEVARRLDGKILFIEETGEFLYRLDRMLTDLKLSGVLSRVSGIIVGGLTKMEDSETAFGKSCEEIVYEALAVYGYPVAMGFPSGHQNDNRALTLGREIRLAVDNGISEISYL